MEDKEVKGQGQGQGSQFAEEHSTPNKHDTNDEEQQSGHKRPLADATNDENIPPKRQKADLGVTNDDAAGTQQPTYDVPIAPQQMPFTQDVHAPSSGDIDDDIADSDEHDNASNVSSVDHDSERSRSRHKSNAKRHSHGDASQTANKFRLHKKQRSRRTDVHEKYQKLKAKYDDMARHQKDNANVVSTLTAEIITATAKIADFKVSEQQQVTQINDLQQKLNHAHSNWQAAIRERDNHVDRAERATMAEEQRLQAVQTIAKLRQDMKILQRHNQELQSQVEQRKEPPQSQQAAQQASDNIQAQLFQARAQTQHYKQLLAKAQPQSHSDMHIDSHEQDDDDDDAPKLYVRWGVPIPDQPPVAMADSMRILSVMSNEIGLISKTHVDEVWGGFPKQLRVGHINKQLELETMRAKTMLYKESLAANSKLASVINAHMFTTWYQPPAARRYITFKVSGRKDAPTHTTTTATAGDVLIEHHTRVYGTNPAVSQLTVIAHDKNITGRIDAPQCPFHMMGDHSMVMWMNGSIELNIDGNTIIPIQDCIGGITFTNKNLKITPTHLHSKTDPMVIIAFGWNAECCVVDTQDPIEIGRYNAIARRELTETALLPQQPQDLDAIDNEQSEDEDDDALAFLVATQTSMRSSRHKRGRGRGGSSHNRGSRGKRGQGSNRQHRNRQ